MNCNNNQQIHIDQLENAFILRNVLQHKNIVKKYLYVL